MSDRGAFARVFGAEMDAAQHAALVGLFVWANGSGYGADALLSARAEAWACGVEARGLGLSVLETTAGATRR